MTLAMITPPALEPLGLDEIKLHLRIDHDDEDTLLMSTLSAARHYVELRCGRKLITQAWRQYEAEFPPGYELPLRLAPVQDILSVVSFDREGNPASLEPLYVSLIHGRHGAVLKFDSGLDPQVAANGLEIDLLVGMGDLGLDVDDALKRAILLLVTHWYEFRGAVPPGQQPVSLPPGLDALMAPYRRVGL